MGDGDACGSTGRVTSEIDEVVAGVSSCVEALGSAPGIPSSMLLGRDEAAPFTAGDPSLLSELEAPPRKALAVVKPLSAAARVVRDALGSRV
jgi:hypothetical protein